MRQIEREFPFPIPLGWFLVCYSDELAVGEVKSVHYFASDLVLFRDDSGSARCFDAYCPHLGAHLGVGGEIVEGTLRCPFHHWRFDNDGKCVEIPYATRIPPAAKVRSYPVIEKNGMVFAWYHPGEEAPTWELPDIPECGDEAWTKLERREWIVKSCGQELAENTVDQAHFRYVHGTNTVAETDITTEGPIMKVISSSKVAGAEGEADGVIEIDVFGFGFGMTRFTGVVETLVLTAGTPIDEERVHMRLSFTGRKLADSDSTKGLGRAFMSEIERQFGQDIPIWENKIHHARPVLCDGDGPIGLVRQWAKQFYLDAPG
jgi:phenylpropionate dioxygenase-like ring-hydroxylating dioxygenase large terminal subunit